MSVSERVVNSAKIEELKSYGPNPKFSLKQRASLSAADVDFLKRVSVFCKSGATICSTFFPLKVASFILITNWRTKGPLPIVHKPNFSIPLYFALRNMDGSNSLWTLFETAEDSTRYIMSFFFLQFICWEKKTSFVSIAHAYRDRKGGEQHGNWKSTIKTGHRWLTRLLSSNLLALSWPTGVRPLSFAMVGQQSWPTVGQLFTESWPTL